MTTRIKNLFRNEKQFRLFSLLFLSTCFCFALIATRMYYMGFSISEVQSTDDIASLRGTTTFLFLVWNLFLAWIPYWIALSIDVFHQKFNSKILTGIVLSSWLFFLPNAPYIVTDLLHLRWRQPIPMWYDMMLIVSFAWTGLMLGFFSLHEIQLFLKKRVNNIIAWIFIIFAISLTGFGIFLGRFLRWNTWDILTNPISLFHDIGITLLYPFAQDSSFGIAIVSSVFLLLGYLTLNTLVDE